ncbi:MAG: VCBS repeat-containing protein [Bacteroidetes bacterium]|nr:VCBS repeat-containing protein [Bacteroidota bacterium]
MKTTTKFKAILFALAGFISVGNTANAQLAFTDSNSKISGPFHSGCATTVTDVNFDGMDDLFRLDQGNALYLDLQNRDGSFTTHFIVNHGGGSSWAMTCADVDQNGWKDVAFDGGSGIQVIKIFGGGGSITYTSMTLANSGFFLQNATFADMNNDGWIDLFCCDDNGPSQLYLNDGAGLLNISTFVNFAVNPGIDYNGDPADSGNYGSTWIDFDNDNDLDLYVAHCRQSTTSPTDLRRINRLFVNDGSNNYTEMANAFGIDIGWQTWTASFGDLDNDGDLDLVLTNHDHTSQIFVNDGTGHYTENMSTGFNTDAITPIESVVEDFDNDGYADILVTGSEWMYWKNNGNMTFSQVNNLFASNGMLSFASGDLNHDGFIDIYSSYGDIYTSPSSVADVMYLNNGNANNFITFDIKGTTSNINAIGGRATIYGPWGVQVREVRAGESYGTCNSSQLHFGLGSNTVVDSAVVRFPSGTEQRFYGLESNQFVSVLEGTCSVTGNIVSGPSAICTGQTATLTASAGFAAYDWSNGDAGMTSTVSTAGQYNVAVTDGGCTNVSPSIILALNPDETPTVSTSGEVVFCHGGSVTLQSTPATSYSWSNGGTGQSEVITESGLYSVTIQGVCGSFTSAPVLVDVLTPPNPVANGTVITTPQAVTLNATGDLVNWYDQQVGGTLLATGLSYTTPVISIPTTYWIDNTLSYQGATDFTGMPYHQGTAFSGGTTNGTNDFTVLAPCTLHSVKVYTDSVGMREIQLLDASNAVVNSVMVNIPVDSSRVTLNFALTPGTYHLTTNSTVNQSSFGTNAPRLRRSSLNVLYPYTINNLISVTGSNQGAFYYYYFFDWEVQAASYNCTSDRIPVLVDVSTGINDIAFQGVSIYPNPAHDFVTIDTDSPILVNVYDASSRLVKSDKYTASSNKLSISDLASGIYQIRLTKDGKTANYKLVVNN